TRCRALCSRPGDDLARAAALGGFVLPSRGGMAAPPGDPLPGLRPAAVVVHRLSHYPSPVVSIVAAVLGLCPVGIADLRLVRGGCLDRFSTDADAGNDVGNAE